MPREGKVDGRIRIPRDRVKIEQRIGFDLPRLAGFGPGQRPGATELLEQVRHVALPGDATSLVIEADVGTPVRLPGPVNPFPVQSPIFDIPTEGERRNGLSAQTQRVRFTPLDRAIETARRPYPSELVTLGRVDWLHGVQVASVLVRPLQYDPLERSYLLFPDIRYRVKYQRSGTPPVPPPPGGDVRIGRHRAAQFTKLIGAATVEAAGDLVSPVGELPGGMFNVAEEVPHVIITDDVGWPNTAVAGGQGGGTRAPKLSEKGGAVKKGRRRQGAGGSFPAPRRMENVARRALTGGDGLGDRRQDARGFHGKGFRPRPAGGDPQLHQVRRQGMGHGLRSARWRDLHCSDTQS